MCAEKTEKTDKVCANASVKKCTNTVGGAMKAKKLYKFVKKISIDLEKIFNLMYNK